MTINILSIHFSAVFKKCFFGLLRFYDRRFTSDKRKTRKLHQHDYETQYVGIEFYIECRYAQVISTVYNLMMYSSGMPVLYIVGAVHFFLMYWTDKFFCKIGLFNIKYSHSMVQGTAKVWFRTVLALSQVHEVRCALPLSLWLLHVLIIFDIHDGGVQVWGQLSSAP